MGIGRTAQRRVALAAVITLSVLGVSGVASAKTPAHGCHRTHTCKGGGGGTGGPPPTIIVTASPNPLVETGESNVDTVVQVETSPSFAGDQVTIWSSQMNTSCSALYLETEQPYGPLTYNNMTYSKDEPLTVTLDDDGNVTVVLNGYNCAPGSDLIEADLVSAPYYTATTILVVEPPQVTPPGVTVFPNPEVETGQTVTVSDGEEGTITYYGSDVYAVFYVETSPVYAEQQVEITDNQLADSCGGGFDWYDSFTDVLNSSMPAQPLDDDGNAVFVFFGSSCAATTSQVIADVVAGTHPTYLTTFTVNPPVPTI